MNRKAIATIGSAGALVAGIGVVVGIAVSASGSTPAKAPAQVRPAAVTVTSHAASTAAPVKKKAVVPVRHVAVKPADVPAPTASSATVGDVSMPTDTTPTDDGTTYPVETSGTASNGFPIPVGPPPAIPGQSSSPQASPSLVGTGPINGSSSPAN